MPSLLEGGSSERRVDAAGLDLVVRPRPAERIHETYYELAAAAQGGTG
jgi:hypothetical protein